MLSALPPCSAALLLGLAVGFGRSADAADNTVTAPSSRHRMHSAWDFREEIRRAFLCNMRELVADQGSLAQALPVVVTGAKGPCWKLGGFYSRKMASRV